MVVKTYACVQPRTMMIKPFHAVAAVDAMSRSTGSDNFAVGTERGAIKYFEQADELYALLLDVTRVSDCHDEEKQKHQTVGCECNIGQDKRLVRENFSKAEEKTERLQEQEEVELCAHFLRWYHFAILCYFLVFIFGHQDFSDVWLYRIVSESVHVIYRKEAFAVFHIGIRPFH